ncbi:CASP-like protein 4D1 [Gossypium australe]|uniref:CASP-like protein 4D1 n=1 Tax=Gossypium australe TaxID=47621 RepID=A0A5B6WLA0_9ROSI|nr:CASP-like protein 4D1 [Gossypium australe]
MHGAFPVDFYGDKVISYVLASGSADGFGATKDMKALADATNVDDLDDYYKAYASASFLLFAFTCAAILSVFSSYALPKMRNGKRPERKETESERNTKLEIFQQRHNPTIVRPRNFTIIP